MALELARSFIEAQEGCQLKAYLCTAGHLTIGYGHTGPDVIPGLVISQARADALFAQDLDHAEDALKAMVSVLLNENQEAALLSFIFNLGPGRFYSSTLRVLVNQEKFQEAADQFPLWCHEHRDGKLVENAGLKARRERERALFLATNPMS